MRKLLYALTIAGLLTGGVWAQQSGGAFIPSFAYDIAGAWNFSGTIPTLTGNGSVVGTSATQTLTNKTLTTGTTLTAPVLNAPVTTTNIGAKNGATVTVVEKGEGIIHQTVFTLTALPLTLADLTVGAGVKIYDFPEGQITILGASASVAETTTSVLADTLNTGVTYNWGVGTTTQASATLATTEQDIVPVTNGTASSTINVAGAASGAVRAAAPVNFDGTGTAKDAFFNVAIATATDIDADATTTWTGTITITWMFNGDK